MKTLMKVCLAAAFSAMVFFSCGKEDEAHLMLNPEPSSKVPANNFFPVFTIYEWSGHQDGLPGSFNFCWEGSGSEPGFGTFFVKITFCCDLSTGYYKDSEGYFELRKNGDKLYFYLSDGVITDYSEEDSNYRWDRATDRHGVKTDYPNGNSDYYHKCFKALAKITGGTGIFKDASGDFLTNALIHIESGFWKADCFSQGCLSHFPDRNPKREELTPDLIEIR